MHSLRTLSKLQARNCNRRTLRRRAGRPTRSVLARASMARQSRRGATCRKLARSSRRLSQTQRRMTFRTGAIRSRGISGIMKDRPKRKVMTRKQRPLHLVYMPPFWQSTTSQNKSSESRHPPRRRKARSSCSNSKTRTNRPPLHPPRRSSQSAGSPCAPLGHKRTRIIQQEEA
jgi:hypothetical protein